LWLGNLEVLRAAGPRNIGEFLKGTVVAHDHHVTVQILTRIGAGGVIFRYSLAREFRSR
jgi:hypothetical protein